MKYQAQHFVDFNSFVWCLKISIHRAIVETWRPTSSYLQGLVGTVCYFVLHGAPPIDCHDVIPPGSRNPGIREVPIPNPGIEKLGPGLQSLLPSSTPQLVIDRWVDTPTADAHAQHRNFRILGLCECISSMEDKGLDNLNTSTYEAWKLM